MVRLVFRPYTQVRRSICTSESLRASTRISPGFTLLIHSSPSFGSQQPNSLSHRRATEGFCSKSLFDFSAHKVFSHLNACVAAELLGPCFKTGRYTLFCQPERKLKKINKIEKKK